MKKQFWYSIAISTGILISNGEAAAQPRVDPQTDARRPIIFGVPAPRPNATPAPAPHTPTVTPTTPHTPYVHRDRDRRHDRDWRRERYRHERFRREHARAGWERGRKTGWHGRDLPPGQAKKAEYARNWRDHDRDDHRGHDRGHRR